VPTISSSRAAAWTGRKGVLKCQHFMMQPQISTISKINLRDANAGHSPGTNILYCISRPTYAAASSLSSAARDPATNLEPHNAGF